MYRRFAVAIAVVCVLALLGLAAGTRLTGRASMSTRYMGTTRAPEFPGYAEWLNTSHSYHMQELRGKIVLLDFWTYCCINCMHIIPDLARLEEKYPNELVVIGVHSAKFTGEQDTENIRQAILRYGIRHPVINDYRFTLWRAYGVHAWPTVALVDPEGTIVGMHSGEGIYDVFDPIISEMVEHFGAEGKLDRVPLPIELEEVHAPSSLLSFPGKILADEASRRLYISDSNHNRIIIATLPMAADEPARVLRLVGSGREGFDDGPIDRATFNHPQGMALDGPAAASAGLSSTQLYVADTENHAIRAVDLATGMVSTVAGAGRQAGMMNRPGVGREVALSSPWDLVRVGRKLYIAMAGSHQIWVLDLDTQRAEPFAGTGQEGRTDGELGAVEFAQPSGLATDGEQLYVADTEVSAIRIVDLKPRDGRVRTLAGGELFEFGLKDGQRLDARFQHPIGVAWHDGTIYVADTYNNAVRAIDAATGDVRTFLGDGRAGTEDGNRPRFDEPNDVKVVGNLLYIADTNNHRIRIAPLSTRSTRTLSFLNPEVLLPKPISEEEEPAPARVVEVPRQTVAPGQVEIVVDVAFPQGSHLNADAPSAWVVHELAGSIITSNGASGRIQEVPVHIPMTVTDGPDTVAVDLVLYYCQEKTSSLCYFTDVRLKIPVVAQRGASGSRINVRHVVEVAM